jgi:hypothetical protein
VVGMMPDEDPVAIVTLCYTPNCGLPTSASSVWVPWDLSRDGGLAWRAHGLATADLHGTGEGPAEHHAEGECRRGHHAAAEGLAH